MLSFFGKEATNGSIRRPFTTPVRLIKAMLECINNSSSSNNNCSNNNKYYYSHNNNHNCSSNNNNSHIVSVWRCCLCQPL